MSGLDASGEASSDQRTSWVPIPDPPLPPSIPRLILGMMVTTSFLSMWLSNTASTTMMLPIAIAILKSLFSQKEMRKDLNWESEENTGEAGERDWGPTPARWRSGSGDVQRLSGKVKVIHLLSTYYVPRILIIIIIIEN